jgi:predicted Zn-dependent protease
MISRLCLVAFIGAGLNAQQFDPAKAAALGASMAAEWQKNTTPVSDRTLQDYIAGLGQQLSPGRSWKFTVIRDDAGGVTHEPVSLPGGYIFVPASLIVDTGNEAELAAMLAHAIAHEILPRIVWQESTIPTMLIVSAAYPRAIPVGSMKLLRQDELAADRTALTLLKSAGYAPTALSDYIRHTRNEPAGFSSWPSRRERLNALDATPAGGKLDSDEFQTIRQTLEASRLRKRPSLILPQDRQ